MEYLTYIYISTNRYQAHPKKEVAKQVHDHPLVTTRNLCKQSFMFMEETIKV